MELFVLAGFFIVPLLMVAIPVVGVGAIIWLVARWAVRRNQRTPR